MLTELLLRMQPRWWHLTMWALGLSRETFHEWLEGFCPCELGDNEAEYELLERAIEQLDLAAA